MTISEPVGDVLGNWMPDEPVVMLHDVVRFPADHIDFVKRQDRLERRMNDQNGNAFHDEAFYTVDPGFLSGNALANEDRVDDAAAEEEFPFVCAIAGSWRELQNL